MEESATFGPDLRERCVTNELLIPLPIFRAEYRNEVRSSHIVPYVYQVGTTSVPRSGHPPDGEERALVAVEPYGRPLFRAGGGQFAHIPADWGQTEGRYGLSTEIG